jgi:hypothetical protein
MTTDENGTVLSVDDRVEGGDTEQDRDTGTVGAIDGNQITVLWDSQVKTAQRADLLRKID